MPTAEEHQQLLNHEYQRFIEFGQVLDRTGRRYLVQFIRSQLEPDLPLPPDINSQYYRYFKKALAGVFSIEKLAKLCQQNAGMRRQVATDTLKWLRQTYKEIRQKHPFEDEVSRLQQWSVTPLGLFLDRYSVLLTFLDQTYSVDELPVGFFVDRFKDIARQQAGPERTASAEPLVRDLLAQWDALLNTKILDHQLHHLEARVEEYQELMEAKVEEYSKLIDIVSPFSNYLSGYWDMSRSLWQNTSFDVLKQYADLLAREDELRELADMLGQWREAEIEIEEETFEKTIVRQQWVSDPQMRSEISGIHESSDLNTLLSGEAALLSDSDTESAFLKRFADGQLMTFRYDDQRLETSTDHEVEIYNRVRDKERGPFILCVDTSESMMGRPEQVAKVLALGILKMAGHVGRRAYLISFSTGIQTLDLHDVSRSLEDIAAFLLMSFRGGTDISLPLYECFRQLRGDDYQDADVLVISDFIMYKLDKDIMEEMNHFQHNKATEFHALVLSESANETLVKSFDTTWQYDGEGIVKRVARDILSQK